jgi:hypothetical protein
MTLSHDDLTDRDTLAGEEVEVLPVLHHPASVGELAVNRTRAAVQRQDAPRPSFVLPRARHGVTGSMFGMFAAPSAVAITVGDGSSHEVEFRGVEKLITPMT